VVLNCMGERGVDALGATSDLVCSAQKAALLSPLPKM